MERLPISAKGASSLVSRFHEDRFWLLLERTKSSNEDDIARQNEDNATRSDGGEAKLARRGDGGSEEGVDSCSYREMSTISRCKSKNS